MRVKKDYENGAITTRERQRRKVDILQHSAMQTKMVDSTKESYGSRFLKESGLLSAIQNENKDDHLDSSIDSMTWTMKDWDDDAPIAEFLLKHPEHRHTVRRAQISRIAPYGEIHDNTIAADVMPIDMLRAKLSFFGATHFDPRSDRWVRICMYAGAPYPEELAPTNADDWVFPELSV